MSSEVVTDGGSVGQGFRALSAFPTRHSLSNTYALYRRLPDPTRVGVHAWHSRVCAVSEKPLVTCPTICTVDWTTGQVPMAARSRSGPIYLQIADGLKARIESLGPGARIPSEPQLARDWGVSRFTVAKAVEQLVDEGLITRRQGSGSFVAEAPLRRAPGYLLSFTEAVSAAGHSASHRLLGSKPNQAIEGL